MDVARGERCERLVKDASWSDWGEDGWGISGVIVVTGDKELVSQMR